MATRTTRLLKLECACPRIIRASQLVSETGAIVCEVCGQRFELSEAEEEVRDA
jgi:uncharacterized Zn finger protein (UPF0148 family)